MALGGIAVSDVAIQTAAADNKVMPGTACDEGDEAFLTNRTNPRFLQSDADAQVYMCPVLRDDTTDDLDRLIVSVDNQVGGTGSPGDALRCTIHSISPDGTQIESAQAEAISLGLATLQFVLTDFLEFDKGHYVLQCDLHQNDRILQYRWRED